MLTNGDVFLFYQFCNVIPTTHSHHLSLCNTIHRLNTASLYQLNRKSKVCILGKIPSGFLNTLVYHYILILPKPVHYFNAKQSVVNGDVRHLLTSVESLQDCWQKVLYKPWTLLFFHCSIILNTIQQMHLYIQNLIYVLK